MRIQLVDGCRTKHRVATKEVLVIKSVSTRHGDPGSRK